MRLLGEKVQDSIRYRSVDPLMGFIYSSLMEGAEFIAHVPIAAARAAASAARFGSIPPRRRCSTPSRTCRRSSGNWPRKRWKRRAALPPGKLHRSPGQGEPALPHAGRRRCLQRLRNPADRLPALVSTDVQRCISTFVEGSDVGFPGLKVWLTLRDSYSTALEGALIHAGLAHQAHEWNESLQIAMTTPDAEERWLSGADVLRMPCAPAPSAFESPMWRRSTWTPSAHRRRNEEPLALRAARHPSNGVRSGGPLAQSVEQLTFNQ